MKAIVIFTLMLSVMASAAIALPIKFKRVDNPQVKNRLKQKDVLIAVKKDAQITLKPGSEVSVDIEHDFSEPIKITVFSYGQGFAEYSLKARPDQNYVFEVGFEPKMLSIKLVEGKELALDERVVKQPSDPSVDIKVGRKDGIGFVVEKVDPSENIRQEWLRRGGKLNSNTITFNGVHFSMDLTDFNTKVSGYGGGLSVYYTWYNLKPPVPKPGIATWGNFSYGLGYDGLIYYYDLNIKQSTMNMSLSVLNASFPIYGSLGYTFGLGKFVDEGNWRGVTITFKIRPSITINNSTTTTTIEILEPYPIENTDTQSDFSVTFNSGFGYDFEFSSFSATMARLAPVAATKISFFVLPALKKGDPYFVSFGIGFTLYSR